MRNFVVKNDFNRASVHPDQKKDWEPSVDEGYEDWLEQQKESDNNDSDNPKNADLGDLSALMNSEYARGVKASRIC